MRPNAVTLTITQGGIHATPSLTAADLLHIAADLAVAAIVDASLGEPDPYSVASECTEWISTNVNMAVYAAVSHVQ